MMCVCVEKRSHCSVMWTYANVNWGSCQKVRILLTKGEPEERCAINYFISPVPPGTACRQAEWMMLRNVALCNSPLQLQPTPRTHAILNTCSDPISLVMLPLGVKFQFIWYLAYYMYITLPWSHQPNVCHVSDRVVFSKGLSVWQLTT